MSDQTNATQNYALMPLAGVVAPVIAGVLAPAAYKGIGGSAPAANAGFATQRALAVRHALVANGVAPGRLVLDTPTLTSGGAGAREARRVELRLR